MKLLSKPMILTGLALLTALPASAITWRSQYYNLTAARDFGRDHISFRGTGHNFSCTGNLILQNNRLLTARHCPVAAGNSWTIRTHPSVTAQSSVGNPNLDIRLVRLNNSGGTPVQLWDNGSESGKTFHKAGSGAHGDINSVSGSWFGAGEPLAGHNTYTGTPNNTATYVLKTNAYSVGTAGGDSGGPGLMKLANGAWSVSSTTIGASGTYVDARVWHARNWILANM